ncbi:MAG: hypothetical protein LBE78_07285 [Burkholderiaceae bacterium]|jgi:hypothetical protein|nr:hypothetical protein [Burkholderiaceae bacterium]
MRIIVLGGLGNFGARICRALAQMADIERGAMPCMGLLKLADFSPCFDQWGMRTTITAS